MPQSRTCRTADALLFLDEHLDNLIVSLQSTQSDFVEMYGNVRLISSSPTNTRSLTTLCIDAEGSTPIANVVLTILSDNTKRKSPVSGFNVFQNLKAGKEQIRVEHVDYKTQIIDFTMVTGNTTELAITMVKISSISVHVKAPSDGCFFSFALLFLKCDDTNHRRSTNRLIANLLIGSLFLHFYLSCKYFYEKNTSYY
jgi:hypothetical protein